MTEAHYADEAFFQEPMTPFHHVVVHHSDLGHWSADVYETEQDKIEKDLAPGGQVVLIVIGFVGRRHARGPSTLDIGEWTFDTLAQTTFSISHFPFSIIAEFFVFFRVISWTEI